jgi:hypothetical protein
MKKYSSIVRHGKSGTHLTITGNPKIVIQEKLDGANASFKRVGPELLAFSRNTQLDDENNLRGFYQWVQQTIDIEKIDEDIVYFGEWTAKHKLDYGDNHDRFYLFDIYDDTKGEYLPFNILEQQATILKINLIPVFYEGEFQSLDHIHSFVGKSFLGKTGEGVVVKNYNYADKYGNQIFTKFVSDEFAEVSKTKKHVVNTDPIQEFINSTLTEARISKLLHKMVDEGQLQEDYAIEDMRVILKHLGIAVYEDIMKEESDSLMKLVKSRMGRTIPNVIKQVLISEGRA